MTRAFACALALASLAARCEVERPYPPPTAAELRAYVERMHAGTRTLRAEARVEYETERGRVRATVMMLAKEDLLRFDVLSPVGTTLQTLVARGDDYDLLDVEKNRFERGSGACGPAEVIPLGGLGAGDVSRALRGGAPLWPGSSDVEWDRSEGAEVLRVRATDGRSQEVRLRGNRGRWTLERTEFRDRNGRLTLVIEPGDGSLGLRSETRRESVVIRFRRVERNVDLREDLFRLAPPPGVSVDQRSGDDCGGVQ